jgi:hypothetical protein
MISSTRASLLTAGAALALLMSSGSVVLAYGETPPELIDPECEPEQALEADPALVAPPDGICPPDYVPLEERSPRPAPEEPPAPLPAPVVLPPEQPGKRDTPRPAPRLRAERHATSGGAEAPPPRRRARRRSRPERPSGGGAVAPDAPVAPDVQPEVVADPQAGMPAFLLPIYRSAGRRYGIPWEILAAINEIESAYGRNLNVSSAGAVGWMQFMPPTWRAYGTDANGDGVADPYDPVDAIHSAAHYLSASGYAVDPRGALFAYNHAEWYVDWVLARAAEIAAGGVLVRDPLRRARRLDPAFAATLAVVSERAQVSWGLVLAVLRVQGHSGRVPATEPELERLSSRLVAVGATYEPRTAVRRLAGDAPLRARRIIALTHYHRAVGLRGLVRGLERVRRHLARRVLRSPRLEIYPAGRADIRSGVTDVRVLVLLRYLASRYNEVTVTSLTTGHSYLTASGNVSAHSHGRAVDLAELNGTPIFGNQAPGGLTERALWNILLLPEELRPRELISLFELGGPSFALEDHADHIHVGY